MTAQSIAEFRETSALSIGDNLWQKARETFDGHRLDDMETKTVIGEVQGGRTVICWIRTARSQFPRHGPKPTVSDTPVIALATAHPAKFPDAVQEASGIRPALPPALADLYERQERMTVLPNDLAQVEAFVRDHVSLPGAA